MSTAGDPAASIIEHRRPTPYLAIGAGTLSAAAILIVTLSAIVGASPDPQSVRTALALAVILLFCGGLYAMGQHRSARRRAVAAKAERVRYDAWAQEEEADRELLRALARDVNSIMRCVSALVRAQEADRERVGILVQDMDDLKLALDQNGVRIGWIVKHLAAKPGQPGTAQPSSRKSRPHRHRKTVRPTQPPAPTGQIEAPPSNVVQLPNPRTVEALKAIASHLLRPPSGPQKLQE